MTALLSFARLQKRLPGQERLLLDLDGFAIQPASAYVLTGVNGAGKSSLLRILAGLDTAETGGVYFHGRPVRFQPYPNDLRAAIVYVHQHPVMFVGSVQDNVAYGLKARGQMGAGMQDEIDKALAWAGILHLRDASAKRLSGGEQQRVALARAMVLKPACLLLDEPTSNLDGAAREQVIALIPGLVAAGSSVVMACHDRDLIALPGVQRWKLRDGKIEVRGG
jgi:tungstate transport system ATP-binding protein